MRVVDIGWCGVGLYLSDADGALQRRGTSSFDFRCFGKSFDMVVRVLGGWGVRAMVRVMG